MRPMFRPLFASVYVLTCSNTPAHLIVCRRLVCTCTSVHTRILRAPCSQPRHAHDITPSAGYVADFEDSAYSVNNQPSCPDLRSSDRHSRALSDGLQVFVKINEVVAFVGNQERGADELYKAPESARKSQCQRRSQCVWKVVVIGEQ